MARDIQLIHTINSRRLELIRRGRDPAMIVLSMEWRPTVRLITEEYVSFRGQGCRILGITAVFTTDVPEYFVEVYSAP